MAYDKQKVIDIALAQVGYHEKASNSGLESFAANSGGNNWTKYAKDLDAIHYFNTPKQSLAWCAVFVCWCFVKAYGAEGGVSVSGLYSGAGADGAIIIRNSED